MQLDQVIIRPSPSTYIVQYSDNLGRTNNLAVDVAGNAAVAALLADAQKRIPKEQDRPDKTEVQQEINELEYRLTQLKKSIGEA